MNDMDVVHPGRKSPEDASARVAPLTNIPRLLRQFGCDPGPVFEASGFGVTGFESPEDSVSFRAGGRLLGRCVAATGCEHFGLLLGQLVNPSFLGVPGFMARSAPDVGTALRAMVEYMRLYDQAGVLTLETNGTTTTLSYAVNLADVEAVGQICDMSIAAGCNIMRGLCGADWNPIEVLLSRRPPRDPTPYREFFRAPLRFDSEWNTLLFLSRWLSHPLATADSLLHSYLKRDADRLRADQHDLRSDLRGLVRQILTSHRCSVGEAARQLSMHGRTLNRRLKAEGTTFRRELNDVRFTMAQQYLQETSMTLTEISTALGYAGISGFDRAFKRWSGITPAEFRGKGHT